MVQNGQVISRNQAPTKITGCNMWRLDMKQERRERKTRHEGSEPLSRKRDNDKKSERVTKKRENDKKKEGCGQRKRKYLVRLVVGAPGDEGAIPRGRDHPARYLVRRHLIHKPKRYPPTGIVIRQRKTSDACIDSSCCALTKHATCPV